MTNIDAVSQFLQHIIHQMQRVRLEEQLMD